MGFFVVFVCLGCKTSTQTQGPAFVRENELGGVQSATAQKLQRCMRDVVGGGRRWSDVCGVSGQTVEEINLGQSQRREAKKGQGRGNNPDNTFLPRLAQGGVTAGRTHSEKKVQ
jgi:hypothetical protein